MKRAVTLIVRDEKWGVQLNVNQFPIQCPNCLQFATKLYQHKGSRYGHVGTVTCEYCHSKLSLVDSDFYVDYIKISTGDKSLTLTFKSLFQLEKQDFDLLKSSLGYDIIQAHKGKEIPLHVLLAELSNLYSLNLKEQVLDFPAPQSVKQWNYLIKMIREDPHSFTPDEK